jgi:acyl-CoA synthetase (NDP forming)
MGKPDENWDLTPLVYPKSIVIVGLSRRNFNHPGNTTFIKNQMEMTVKAYGVSPNTDEEQGFHIYPSIKSLPEIPDLAVICVNAQHTFEAIKEAANFGVKSAIVIGGGFAETGENGKKLQDEMVQICRDFHMPMIGPNCIGVFSPPIVDTIFLPTERIIKPRQGNVAIVSQSGGVVLDQFFLSCVERNIGVSSAISIGNKAMIKETHLLKFFEKDPRTDIIAFYLEGFEPEEGREFIEIAQQSKKDIVVYMGGKSDAGKLAAGSHTASIASNAAIMEGAFKQYSIIQAYSELEVKNYLKVLSMLSNPHRRFTTMAMKGENIAVLTVSGGHGVLCVDLLEKYQLKLAKFSNEQKQQMELLLNPNAAKIASFNNPIDVTGACQEEDIVNLLDYLLTQLNVDLIIMLLLPYPPQISMHLGRQILKISSKWTKPIITFVPWTEKYDLIRNSLEINFIPCAHTVEESVMMASAIRLKGLGGIRRKMNWR